MLELLAYQPWDCPQTFGAALSPLPHSVGGRGRCRAEVTPRSPASQLMCGVRPPSAPPHPIRSALPSPPRGPPGVSALSARPRRVRRRSPSRRSAPSPSPPGVRRLRRRRLAGWPGARPPGGPSLRAWPCALVPCAWLAGRPSPLSPQTRHEKARERGHGGDETPAGLTGQRAHLGRGPAGRGGGSVGEQSRLPYPLTNQAHYGGRRSKTSTSLITTNELPRSSSATSARKESIRMGESTTTTTRGASSTSRRV